MKPDIQQFVVSDGYVLHFRHWRPRAAPPMGYVVGLHGIQSHSGWYEHSARQLCEAGYDVSLLDRRGSGLNRPQRGHAQHHERLLYDVVQFLAEVRWRRHREAPERPVVLHAVSWGGKLAAVVAARRPESMEGLALLCPGICPRIAPTTFQQLQLRFAELLGIRAKPIDIPLDDPWLFTDDHEWQDFIRHDPLSLHQVTVSFLLASRDIDALARLAPPQIRCPTLLMLAGRDRIIDNAATRRYFDRFASSSRQTIEFSHSQHTLEFEPNREGIVADLIDWMVPLRGPC